LNSDKNEFYNEDDIPDLIKDYGYENDDNSDTINISN
jgi:hypothetical protein